MADTKTTDLTADTNPSTDDLLFTVNDPGGTPANRKVTIANFKASAGMTASATEKGCVELATDAETITGTDTARAITPANLQAKVASDTAKGIVELATDAETETGTDTVRAVTPANAASAYTKKSTLTTKGDTWAATAASTPARVAAGSNGHLYRANSAATPGVEYASVFAAAGGVAMGMTSARYYLNSSIGGNTSALTGNQVMYVPMWFGRACTLDRIGVLVSTNIATSVIRLGLYTSSGGLPTTLIADYGTVNSATTGAKEITISQAVDAGVYWAAVVNQVAGSVVLRGGAGANLVPAFGDTVTTNYASGNAAYGYTEAGVSGALNGTATVGGVMSALTPPTVLVRAT